MTSVKDPFLLLELARHFQNVNFVMAGGGDLLDAVKGTAPKNVTVIGWTDASTFWSAVDCAISTSDNEGMPVALIEAQLAGLPVIATDVGSTSEVIESGVTGFVTSKSISSLANALQLITSDKLVLKKMGYAGQVRATAKFNPGLMLKSHLNAYFDLLHNEKNS
jgi:glycosyltransferase involved in cell wall biosynthesis